MKLFNGDDEPYETYAPSWSVYGFCVFHLLMVPLDIQTYLG